MKIVRCATFCATSGIYVGGAENADKSRKCFGKYGVRINFRVTARNGLKSPDLDF